MQREVAETLVRRITASLLEPGAAERLLADPAWLDEQVRSAVDCCPGEGDWTRSEEASQWAVEFSQRLRLDNPSDLNSDCGADLLEGE